MAANPTMTYTEQHAQALLIPKVTDVGTATRDPDALRAFIHLFRDVQIPDDVQEDAASREANVEAFYLADEPDEIKEASIHLATVCALCISSEHKCGLPTSRHLWRRVAQLHPVPLLVSL